MVKFKGKVTVSGRKPITIAKRIEPSVQSGINAVGKEADVLVRARIKRIYTRPIPTRAQVKAYDKAGRPERGAGLSRVLLAKRRGSKPAWKRTGALKDGQTRLIGRMQNRITIQGRSRIGIKNWANGYASRREAMWKQWTPKKPSMGVRRENVFFAEAAERLAPVVENKFAEAFRRRMG